MKKRNVMLVILLLLIDQGSKGIMEAILTGKSITVIPNFFSLVFVTNTGAAWSIMQGNTLFLIILGIIIFIGYIAYDINKVKRLEGMVDEDKLAIIGALDLYLDFLNLFIRLIQIFGKSNDN